MSTSITWDTVWRVLVSSSIIILGIPVILYAPALLRVVFRKYLKLEVAYKSPRECYQDYKKSKQDDDHRDSFYFDDNKIPSKGDDFFGYYNQQYFTMSPVMRYIRTNGFLLFYVLVQILILMCLGLAVIWAMDADPTSIFASAAIATTLAVFHLADYLRGYFAYIWLVWSSKLKLGDEVVVENHRGVVVELGPMVTVVYVFMVGIPLIGSVPTSSSTPEKKNMFSESEDTLAKEAKLLPHDHKEKPKSFEEESHVLHQIPSLAPGTMSAHQYLMKSPVPMHLTKAPQVPQLPYNMIRNQTIPYRALTNSSSANPQSLRQFNKIKPESNEFNIHGEDGSTVPGEKSATPSRSLASRSGEFIMHRIGYVALPIREHYHVLLPTCNFLMNSFRHFDYSY